MNTSRKTPEQHKTFAKKMTQGCSIRESMMAAGYSEKQANKGQKALNGKMLKALASEGYKLAELARSYSIKEVGDIAMGRLLVNSMTGRDGGVMSAKQLGSHKDLALWQPDAQTGVLVLNMPERLIEKTQAALESLTGDNPSK